MITVGNLTASNIKSNNNIEATSSTLSTLNVTTVLTARNATLSALNVITDLSGRTANLSSIILTTDLSGRTANLSSINLTTDLSARTANLSSLNLKSDLNAVNAYLSSVNLSGNINASTAILSNLNVTSNATITGNLLVYGNLSSLGDVSVIETNVIATSSLSVVNSGTSSGLLINQLNSNPIANFKTNSVDVAIINPTGILVYGTLSSSGNITSPNITNLQNTSGKWDNASNFVQGSSSIVTSISSSSASWLSGNTNLNFLASSINVTNSLTSVSAQFDTLNVTSNATITGNLLVYGNLSSLGEITVVETNVIATSSLSVINTGTTTGLVINQTNNYPIAEFKNNTTSVVSVLSNGVTVNGLLTASGSISSPNINELQTASGTWDQASTFIQGGSSYVTAISSTSGSWLTGNTTIDFVSKTINNTDTLSTTHLHVHQSIINPISTINTNSDLFLTLSSTSYLFVSCGNAINLYLPSVNSINQGLTYIIKNISTSNHDITVKNALSATILTVPYTTYRTFIATNTNTWQYL